MAGILMRGTINDITAELAGRYFPLLAEKLGPVTARRLYSVFANNPERRKGTFHSRDYPGGRHVVGDIDVLEKMLLPLDMIPLFFASEWSEVRLALWLDGQDEKGLPMPRWERLPGSQFHFDLATVLFRARLEGTVPELTEHGRHVVLEAISVLPGDPVR